ncbi:MAG: histidine--tRNA ligase, partial [Synechococcus sp. BS307-5m-G39]|nr:histidine--tRNA ligase [Synechococcus sp. BS307-5m-G39]
KRADRSGAAFALVLGDEEAARGVVRLKALQSASGAETAFPQADWSLNDLDALVAQLRKG